MKDETHDLYRHFDEDGNLLYIGISLSTIYRLSQHRKSSVWYRKVTRIEIEKFPDRDEAIAAEIEAIKDERPLYNVQHNPYPWVDEQESVEDNSENTFSSKGFTDAVLLAWACNLDPILSTLPVRRSE